MSSLKIFKLLSISIKYLLIFLIEVNLLRIISISVFKYMPQFPKKKTLTYVLSFFVFFFPVVKYFSLFHLLLLLWLRGCGHQLRLRGGGRGCGFHPGHCTHTGTLQQVDNRYLIEPGLKNNIIIYILLMSQQVHVMYKYLNGFINPQKRANDDENVCV